MKKTQTLCQSIHHCSIHCIVPPHMLETIKTRGTKDQRKRAAALEKEAEQFRSSRTMATPAGGYQVATVLATGAVPGPKREIYDGESKTALPGSLVRSEGTPPSGDQGVDEAYDGSGDTYKLYADIFGRDSLDGNGMTLKSTVHHRRDYDNAFWNGSQMAYGDGDIFEPLTRSLSVIGHELSHGVVQFSGGLIYRDQSGALNEHIADVFGCLTDQYKKGQEASEAEWLVGAELLGPNINGEALRSMQAPGLAYEDGLLGKDPQPFHMDNFVNTFSDNGGVHINSGIPNHAFYLLSMMLGGNAWDKAGHIWYDALQSINNPHAQFSDWADETVEQASNRFGAGSMEAKLTKRAWKLVGVL
jgi:Zn-dependent metalloprotease